MQRDVTDFNFNLKDQEQIGLAVTKLRELTGHSASKCADMIFSQDPNAKILLFGNSTNGDSNGVATSIQ